MPLMMFLLGMKVCPKVLPTMLFCLPIAFVPALSPGAYSFLGFDRSLANLVKTAVFNNKTKIKQKIISKFVKNKIYKIDIDRLTADSTVSVFCIYIYM